MSSVLTPGNFDGVHAGHRTLVDQTVGIARARGLRSVAMFFDPHPTSVLAPERAPRLLTTTVRRTELLRAMGIESVDARPFNDAFAQQSATDFVQQILLQEHDARALVVGADFRFGRKREGDIPFLRALTQDLGIELHVLPALRIAGDVVSSTRVRRHLANGQLEEVHRLLGRVHDIDAVVEQGDRRGRTLGFPTANLQVPDVQLPPDGVYAVKVRVGEGLHDGVANLGVRPTFQAGRSAEVHLFNFDRDIYGQTIRVGFVAFVRAECRFDGVESLKAQIESDVGVARGVLSDCSEAILRWM